MHLMSYEHCIILREQFWDELPLVACMYVGPTCNK